MNRRDFLKTAGVAGAGGWTGRFWAVPGSWPRNLPKGAPNAEKLGWRLGCQAYSFNRFTFFEAIDKTASLGLHYIEAYPGQRISSDMPAVMSADMTADDRKEVLKKLARFRRQNGQFRRRRLRPEAFRVRQGDGHRNARRRAGRGGFRRHRQALRGVRHQSGHPQPSRSRRTIGTPKRC